MGVVFSGMQPETPLKLQKVLLGRVEGKKKSYITSKLHISHGKVFSPKIVYLINLLGSGIRVPKTHRILHLLCRNTECWQMPFSKLHLVIDLLNMNL